MENFSLFYDSSVGANWANRDGNGSGAFVGGSESHSQTEKWRRDRINSQLSTLRKLVPKSDKMDKAALLGSVVNQLKDLKRKASEMAESALIPSEVDEVTIDHDLDFGPRRTGTSELRGCVKASLSCDDRPELYRELVRALKGLRLAAVRADMSSDGGRTKIVLILCSEDGVWVDSLKQSLKAVLNRIACSSMASSTDRRKIRSKRQRFFCPAPFSS